MLACALLPGLVLWIPMHDSKIKYGLDNGYCLFAIECEKSKQKAHSWYIFFFNFIGYEAVALLCVIIAICLLVVYCMLSAKLKGAKLMMKYLAVLLTAIILNCIILNIMLIGYVADNMWLFTTIFGVIDDFIFLGAYLLVFYSSKASTPWKNFVKLVSRRKTPAQLVDGSKYGTLQSETYWSKSAAPYTGAFTSTTGQSEYTVV